MIIFMGMLVCINWKQDGRPFYFSISLTSLGPKRSELTKPILYAVTGPRGIIFFPASQGAVPGVYWRPAVIHCIIHDHFLLSAMASQQADQYEMASRL